MKCIPKGRNRSFFPDTYGGLRSPSLSDLSLHDMLLYRAGRVRCVVRPDRGKAWKRVIDQWDEHYTFLEDKFNMQQLEQLVKERKFRKDFIYMCHRHKENNKAYYETIFHASMLFNSGLAIVPTRNMINNLGATADSTHFAGSVHTLPKGYRRIFTMKRYEVEFPLKHPRYVIENVAYKKAVYRIMGWGHPWIKIGRSFEELFLNLRYGNFSIITKAIKNRINKWLKRDQHR